MICLKLNRWSICIHHDMDAEPNECRKNLDGKKTGKTAGKSWDSQKEWLLCYFSLYLYVSFH